MSDKKGTTSGKKGNTSDKKASIDMPNFTERDLELLVGAVRCHDGGFPKTDLPKFAAMMGFKTPASAGVSLNSLKKKVMGSPTATPKKSAPAKRKQATSEAVDDDGDDSEEGPATKKPKANPKKVAKKKAEPKQEHGDDEGTAFV